MPAAIANDGTRDLFASFREPAWHRLGTVFTKEVTDYLEMLSIAGMSGINARFESLLVEGLPDVQWAVTPQAVVGTFGGKDRVIGVVGERYEIVQFEEAFAFLQSLHDGARWETAGLIKDGRVGFGSMAFDRDFVLDPNGVADKVESYLLVGASMDGSTGIFGGITPVRVVCQNTLNVARGNLKQSFKFRHTKNVEEKMKAEAALWRQANTYMDNFEKEAQALFKKSVTDDQFFGLVENLFPRPEEDVKGSVKKWENKTEMYAQAWQGAPNAGIKGTGWGAFNALTEANQWGRNTQNTANGAENFAAAGAGFDAATNKFRSQAFEMVKAL